MKSAKPISALKQRKPIKRSWLKALSNSRLWRHNCKPNRKHMKSAKPISALKQRKPAR